MMNASALQELRERLKPLRRIHDDLDTAIEAVSSIEDMSRRAEGRRAELAVLEAQLVEARERIQVAIDAGNAERDAHLAANTEQVAASAAAAVAANERERLALERAELMEQRAAKAQAAFEHFEAALRSLSR